MLAWDETDVTACLEVVPVVDEDGLSHTFCVARDGIRLELVVQEYHGDVGISLYREGIELPIFTVDLRGCDGVRYVDDQRGEYLEFAPAKSVGARYDGSSPIPFGIRVAVKPQIRVSLFSDPAAG